MPLTSLSDNQGVLGQALSNSGNFYVDGALASDVKCGAGMLKAGNIIGYWDNGAQYNMGESISGEVNVDRGSLTNPQALGVGQRNDGMYGTVDVNGDGDWGYLGHLEKWRFLSFGRLIFGRVGQQRRCAILLSRPMIELVPKNWARV